MRLMIERSQQIMTTLFGRSKGVEFTLWFRLELTSEEEQLVSHYQLENHVLIRRDSDQREPWITVAAARQGHKHVVDAIDTILRNEQAIRDACANFKAIVHMAKSFDGREMIEL